MISAIVDTLVARNGSGPMRLNELGKIKIGGLGDARQKASGTGTYRIPQKYDHFTITTLNRNASGNLVPDETLMKQLMADYGDPDGKLRQIPIRVLTDDINDVLQTGFVWYGGKTIGARSDGEKITWLNDPNTGKKLAEPFEEPWDSAFLDYKDSRGNPLLKLHSVLNCVVAAKESRWGGVYKFRTTSIITFKQLYASLMHIHELTGGILRGMPLVMVVRPVQVSPNGTATTVYVVHIELRGAELMQVQQQALQQAAWQLENRQKLLDVRRQYQKLLVAPGHESAEEAADITGEFHPESQILESAPDKYDLLDGDVSTVQTRQSQASPAESDTHDAASGEEGNPETADGGEGEQGGEQGREGEPEKVVINGQHFPATLPPAATVSWINDVILATFPRDKFSSAIAAKKHFHAKDVGSWDALPAERRAAKYESLLLGEVWQ
jgi:hypothetical protein